MTPIEALWNKLQQDALLEPLRESNCRLLKIENTSAFDTFAGIDSSGFAIVAFSCRTKPPAIDFETGALDYFRQGRLNGQWLMALRLKNESLRQVFGRLCQDLIDESHHVLTEAGLISLFRERLVLWKRLFGNSDDGLLKSYQIKGLLGELLALENFNSEFPDAPHALIMAWTGPEGGDQDFHFPEHAVEIKSISPFAEEITISSAAQLDCTLPLELHLYFLKECAQEEPGAISLAQQVVRIENIVHSSPEALRAFRQKLLSVGYVENPYYQTVTFVPVEARRFAVTDQFPKVVDDMLPIGVVHLSYGLSLASIAPYQI
ncbi:PD-(D/E)XK motif protein [Herbaspirillum sp. C9C3]|uniref:PD-(D/E)XK motif protein n=1 Tax=Herbaspirillum sp. C9C3 TaxID=2735271 RepID=UPI001585AC30|nr:PD-(D/E)XK motif protein [Herbaspirillum sp. C9C3]NUT60038.1 PD-(D/E)XK motif protein [Herbaspirillum sp. C9C3]